MKPKYSLQERSPAYLPEDTIREMIEERAAIMEVDAGMERKRAYTAAIGDVGNYQIQLLTNNAK